MTCAVCSSRGFPDASMSMTEDGWTCPQCYVKWQIRQSEQCAAQEQAAKQGLMKVRQVVLAVIILAVAAIFIVAAFRRGL